MTSFLIFVHILHSYLQSSDDRTHRFQKRRFFGFAKYHGSIFSAISFSKLAAVSYLFFLIVLLSSLSSSRL